MALLIGNLRLLLREGNACLAYAQLGRSGTLEVLSTSGGCRMLATVEGFPSRPTEGSQLQPTSQPASVLQASGQQHPGGAVGGRRVRRGAHEVDDLDEPPLPPLRFVSREKLTVRQPVARRIPICFPNITLQMLKLRDKQLAQLRETGWLREVAFKTTPDVTKLEIAAFLESVYGMSVERVHTINYMGRVRQDAPPGRSKRHLYREDDWKKAYVVFRPPAGMGHLLEEEQQQQQPVEGGEGEGLEERPVIEQVREAARAPRPAPRPLPWRRGTRT